MWQALRRVMRSDRGVIAPATAVAMTALIGATALATDVGAWWAERRKLQGALDLAVLTASAWSGANVRDSIVEILARQGYDATVLIDCTTGTYTPDVTVPVADRYTPGADCSGPRDPGLNAVRARARLQLPVFLSRVVFAGTPQTTVSATAARIDEAAIQAGTGVARLQDGIANAVLSGLLGSQISLSAAAYDGLVNTDIDLLSFLDALATRLDLTAGTYEGVLSASTSIGTLLDAAIDVLSREGELTSVEANALDALETLSAQIRGPLQVSLGELAELGTWRRMGVGAPGGPAALSAGLNLYQLVTLSAQVANRGHAIDVPTAAIGIPGLVGLKVKTVAIEPPQPPSIAFGGVGTSVHTAQVRLQLELTIDALLLKNIVKLPLYIEVGYGDATITDISCGESPASDTSVTVSGRSGVANVFLGTVPGGLMSNFSREITQNDLTAAPLLDVSVLLIGVVRLSGKAAITLGRGDAETLVFNRAQIEEREAQTTVSKNMTENLIATIDDTLELEACVLSLGNACLLHVNPRSAVPVTDTLLQVLAGVVGGLDPLVDRLLAALGIKLGYMDVTVTGVRCGVPMLVL